MASNQKSRSRWPPTSSFPIKVIAQPISQLNHCEQLVSSRRRCTAQGASSRRRWTAQGSSRIRRWKKIFDCFNSTNLQISCPGLRDPLSSSQTLQSLPDAGHYHLSLSWPASLSFKGFGKTLCLPSLDNPSDHLLFSLLRDESSPDDIRDGGASNGALGRYLWSALDNFFQVIHPC